MDHSFLATRRSNSNTNSTRATGKGKKLDYRLFSELTDETQLN
jgi:hypothetical protein